jgi:hypothetical protein
MVENACPIIRRDGQPCCAKPGPSGVCWAHDPATAEVRQEARRKGGQGKAKAARAQKLLPPDLQALDVVLDQAINGLVYRGTISPGQGSALAALAGARVRLREVALKLAQEVELREKVSALEERINELGLTPRTNGKAARSVWRRQESMPA